MPVLLWVARSASCKSTIQLILAPFGCALILCVSLLFATPALAESKKLYHWPLLKLTSYVGADFSEHPNGDLTAERAFYWGRVIGSDGLALSIRGMLPHLVEGGWQEPVYHDDGEKKFIFGKAREFQELYRRYGCNDSFLHVHAHPILDPAQTREQWRAAAVEGMKQRAELLRHAGLRRMLLDVEFSKMETVSNDPRFWYDLGRDIMQAMREAHPDILFGFYPGLTNWYLTLSEEEKRGDIPMTNPRHALYKGMYDARGKGNRLWNYEAWLYGACDRCVGGRESKYVWKLERHVKGITELHHQLLGDDIEFVFAKWDLGRSQPAPIFKHFKQPNYSAEMARRNYEVFVENPAVAAIAVWDDFGAWDDAGIYFLSFPDETQFAAWTNQVASLKFNGAYQRSVDTDEEYVQTVGDSLVEKMKLFDVFRNQTGEVHVRAKLATNFAEYVNVTKQVCGKDRLTIPLRDRAEFEWAERYKKQGFFPRQTLVKSKPGAQDYGSLKPEK
ncbi:MAG: hypothetical protein HY360_05285 [Verrucomicrobia bacterium]|nr:hypothetical protein [Verrucomicrobiota bacterium]